MNTQQITIKIYNITYNYFLYWEIYRNRIHKRNLFKNEVELDTVIVKSDWNILVYNHPPTIMAENIYEFSRNKIVYHHL